MTPRRAAALAVPLAAIVLLALACAVLLAGCQPVYRLDDGTTIKNLRADQVENGLARAKLELAELAAQKTRATNAAIAARKLQRSTAPSATADAAWREAQRQGRAVTESYNRAARRLEAGDLAGYRMEVDLLNLLANGLEDYAITAGAVEVSTPMESPRFDPLDIPAPPAEMLNRP